jgi:hypothetical protein
VIGMPTGWIANELAVPRRTIGRWLRNGGSARRLEPARPLAPGPYSYLLGVYLGDGHIAIGAHGQHVLTITCDDAYPGILASIRAAVESVVPGAASWLSSHPVHRWTRVLCSSRWWPVLLPQHGPGRKHDRRIVLTRWQREITAACPRELVRGLIHSDGCRFVANQRVGGKTYSYARYSFSNRSEDIKAIFCAHLDLLGVGWTRPNRYDIAIDRRSEVAKLDGFVGPKR